MQLRPYDLYVQQSFTLGFDFVSLIVTKYEITKIWFIPSHPALVPISQPAIPCPFPAMILVKVKDPDIVQNP